MSVRPRRLSGAPDLERNYCDMSYGVVHRLIVGVSE